MSIDISKGTMIMEKTPPSSPESPPDHQSEISGHKSSNNEGLIITGARYNNDIYTLIVGSKNHAFSVHKNILNLSPVFQCMTNGSFSESVTKEIVLPEDDADSFGRIIEHLYGNNDAAFEINLPDLEGAEKLADMYGLAEKYQLRGLQSRIVQKLKQLDLLKEDCMTFFHIAQKICENTRDSDKIFERYFADQAVKHLKSVSEDEIEELSDMVCSGTWFAKKIVQYQGNSYREMDLEWEMEKVGLKDEVSAAKERLKFATAKSEADLAKASRMHRSQHPGCGYCHVLL